MVDFSRFTMGSRLPALPEIIIPPINPAIIKPAPAVKAPVKQAPIPVPTPLPTPVNPPKRMPGESGPIIAQPNVPPLPMPAPAPVPVPQPMPIPHPFLCLLQHQYRHPFLCRRDAYARIRHQQRYRN